MRRLARAAAGQAPGVRDGLLLGSAFVRFARWRMLSGAVLVALGAVFDGVGLLLLVPLLQATGYGGAGFAGSRFHLLEGYSPSTRLFALLTLFGLLMAVRAVVLGARDRTINRLQTGFVEAVRMRLIGRLAEAGWSRAVQINHARMVQALSVEIYQVGIISNAALTATVSLATLAGYCAVALVLAPVAGSVAIAFALLGACLTQPYLRRVQRLGRALTEAHFGLSDKVSTFLNGLKIASAQGLQGRFVSAYGAASAAVMQDRLASIGLQTGVRTAITTLAACVGAVALFVGVAFGQVSPPVLITLLLVLSRMSGPALALLQGLQQILHGLPAYGAILALEADLSPTASAPARLAPAPAERPEGMLITLEGVTFRYSGAPARGGALERISLAIPAGGFLGVTGPSGSGKTTFLDLVAGILEPQAGRISTHDGALAGAALDAHRERLAYVTQDPFLFDDTVRRNLLWSCGECSDAELYVALDLVGAGPLIAGLEQGLETRLGERGVLVSAGERQRLALARALLRRPGLLILDEATNAIDLASERVILENLAAMRPGTTVVMVAHRPQSLALCDHILEFPGASLSAAGERGVRAAGVR